MRLSAKETQRPRHIDPTDPRERRGVGRTERSGLTYIYYCAYNLEEGVAAPPVFLHLENPMDKRSPAGTQSHRGPTGYD